MGEMTWHRFIGSPTLRDRSAFAVESQRQPTVSTLPSPSP